MQHTGPEGSVTTMDKRDGSHWELFGCQDTEERQTVKAICTEEESESNCDRIFLGEVAATIVEMPEGCNYGKYGKLYEAPHASCY